MITELEKIQYNTPGWSSIHDANIDKLNEDLAGLQIATKNLGEDNVSDVAAATSESITDSTGGTPGQTLTAISGSGADSDINNNFASLSDDYNKLRNDYLAMRTQLNALLAALRVTGGCGVIDDEA